MNDIARVFNQDVETNGGYVYALDRKLSSRLATERWLELMLGLLDLEGRSVVDIGCGDGTFTIRYWDRASPRAMYALDPAVRAVALGDARRGDRPVRFVAADGHHLPYADDAFDVAMLQGVLHHDSEPQATLIEAFRVARDLLILEPNGYSPILKVLEKVSPYHRQHRERSYTARRLRGWIEAAGGQMVDSRLGVTVPVFCPDWLARILKSVEAPVEAAPILNRMLCAVYVFHARRS